MEKSASHAGNVNNVNDVNNVNLSGDSWENPEMDFNFLKLLTFPQREAKNASGRGNVNNLMRLNPCSGNMFLMREMLIMLIMLIPNGDSWENPEMVSTLLTLLTFPEWEAMLIMLNPLADFPKSPEYELTLLTLLTFPLPETFFVESTDLTSLTFLTFPLWEAKNASDKGKC